LLAATIYQENPDRNHKVWNIVSTERYYLFCRQVSFLTASRCQFRGIGQGMKQTHLYLWYPLFQAQWDRLDAINEIAKTQNYLVKGHHLYSGT
jgi:hypothetical protein